MSKDRTTFGRYIEFQASVLRQMPRPEEIDKLALDGWINNQNALKEVLAKVLLPNRVVTDSRFELLTEFELTVPENYVHNKQLALFSKNHRKEFYYYNDDVTDENFSRVTDQLVPGQAYRVKTFGINQLVSSDDILVFMKTQPGIRFVGGQGLSLVYQLKKEEFLIGKYTISIDKKDNLWKDAGGYRRVPRVGRRSDGDWDFSLSNLDGDWHTNYCVLCFCDL